MPALLKPSLNSSQNKENNKMIAFMQIDCEVVDTRLFYFRPEDIPQDYMKILTEEFIFPTEPTTYNRN